MIKTVDRNKKEEIAIKDSIIYRYDDHSVDGIYNKSKDGDDFVIQVFDYSGENKDDIPDDESISCWFMFEILPCVIALA